MNATFRNNINKIWNKLKTTSNVADTDKSILHDETRAPACQNNPSRMKNIQQQKYEEPEADISMD